MDVRSQTEKGVGKVPSALDASDLLWGIEAIAEAIGRTKRQAFHRAASGTLPVRKVGGRYVGSRARLIAFLSGEEA